jgi:hypothetical protein
VVLSRRLSALLPEPVRLVFRGYIGRVQQFEERVTFTESGWESQLPALAERHAQRLRHAPHMIEVEFLDEPDVNQRFFRFGTDPSGMRSPQKITLGGA